MTQDEAPLPSELCKTIFYSGGPIEIDWEVLGGKSVFLYAYERKEGGGEKETETDTEIKRYINRYVKDWQYKCHMSKSVYLSTG